MLHIERAGNTTTIIQSLHKGLVYGGHATTALCAFAMICAPLIPMVGYFFDGEPFAIGNVIASLVGYVFAGFFLWLFRHLRPELFQSGRRIDVDRDARTVTVAPIGPFSRARVVPFSEVTAVVVLPREEETDFSVAPRAVLQLRNGENVMLQIRSDSALRESKKREQDVLADRIAEGTRQAMAG